MTIITITLILTVLFAIALVAMIVSMKLNGISDNISNAVIFSGLSIAGTIFFIDFVKNIRYI